MSFLSRNFKGFVKKSTFVILLAATLAGIVFLRPYFNGSYEKPTLEDRLPKADFLLRCYLLDVAKETEEMLIYNKVPFKDLFTYEFLLAQAKNYGLNLQKPMYIFANENGNWGIVTSVTDSSKVSQGIQRLSKFIELSDTTLNELKVYRYEKENGYIAYQNNWLFIYKGSDFENNFNRIVLARKGDIEPCWKKFMNEKQFQNEKLVLFSNWKKLQDHGVETALFAHDSDSISFRLLSYIKNKKQLNIKMKTSGIELPHTGSFLNQIFVHFDIQDLRKNPDDPLYQLLVKLGKKVSFPTRDFLNAWEGDLSFTQGGTVTIHETYIQSVMDEEFNVSEVKKVKEEKVPGFSLLLSVNENSSTLINKLFAKGILTKHNKHFQFLASPPLSFVKRKNSLLFYSGEYFPKVILNHYNRGTWIQRGTRISFSIDSLSRKEVFGSIHIPVDRIIRRSKFF